MAYLSNTDEEDQQKQGDSSSGFNAFGDQSGANQNQSGGQSLSNWIGSSGGQASSKAPDSSDQAQQNAQEYQSTYAGDDNQDAKSQAAPDSGHSFSNAPTQSGLSGGGQGTGFINFQNYENNAPSQAGAISSAGQQIIGAENTNLTGAEANVANSSPYAKDSIWGTNPDQATVENTVQQQLGQGDSGIAAIQAGLNPYDAPDTVNYIPSKNYTTSAPELTETPVTGGQTKPSVVDYLAQNQIAKGGYSQGDRMLDSNLIAGDTQAQQAIQANQALDKTFQNRVNTEVPNLQANAAAANTNAGNTVNEIQQGLTDTSNKLQNDIATATANYNAHPSAETLAAEQAAVKSYSDWYNSNASTGGVWTGQSTSANPATAVVTSQQANESDDIWKLQHPGDTDPSHLPYPDPNNASVYGTAASYSGSGTSGAAEVGIGSFDPGDKGVNGGAAVPVSDKYADAINGYGAGGIPSNATPAEVATYVATHPTGTKDSAQPSQTDYRQAAFQLQNLIAGYKNALNGPYPQIAQANINRLTTALNSVNGKIQSSSAAKDPYDYGKSLGLDDATLASMGIHQTGSVKLTQDDRRQ